MNYSYEYSSSKYIYVPQIVLHFVEIPNTRNLGAPATRLSPALKGTARDLILVIH